MVILQQSVALPVKQREFNGQVKLLPSWDGWLQSRPSFWCWSKAKDEKLPTANWHRHKLTHLGFVRLWMPTSWFWYGGWLDCSTFCPTFLVVGVFNWLRLQSFTQRLSRACAIALFATYRCWQALRQEFLNWNAFPAMFFFNISIQFISFHIWRCLACYVFGHIVRHGTISQTQACNPLWAFLPEHTKSYKYIACLQLQSVTSIYFNMLSLCIGCGIQAKARSKNQHHLKMRYFWSQSWQDIPQEAKSYKDLACMTMERAQPEFLNLAKRVVSLGEQLGCCNINHI